MSRSSAGDRPPLPATSPGPAWRALLGYALLLALAVGLFLLVRAHGETLRAPPPDPSANHTPRRGAGQGEVLMHVLLALAAVLLAGRLLGKAFAHVGQPPVIGEVVAGILLGPSLLGAEWSAWLLPPEAAPYLGVIAQLGVVLYMFLVGLELNAGSLRAQARATVSVALASMVVPFVGGAVLALYLYPRLSSSDVPFTSFALFMGVATAITAFPVLARILSDRKMTRTELGSLALGIAAIGDVTAWCLLAFVVGVAHARIDGAVRVAGLSLAFVLAMLVAVRPAAGWLVRRAEGRPVTPGVVSWVLLAVLLSALATEAIGIHAIFGAFLLGAVMPHEGSLARELTGKLEDVVVVLLLPAFFAYTGMRTRIGLVAGAQAWLLCGLIVLVATLGKFGGTLLAARLTGLDWRTAASLGVLMNTRGLMELIVLNIGLDLGVISPALFAMMVLMALATTLATTPILKVLEWACPRPVLEARARAGVSEVPS
jgi:Kef-type K+ transport system membrane component KefB